ncbi:MAG TPA: Ig-like domain-containing protein, partial [Gemmatimonadales bacterium]|nr:Ig-like domain-containing protein [Gemmatimonadales bacterium]
QLGAASDFTDVGVLPVSLRSIRVLPPTVSVPVGSTTPFSASGIDDAGNVVPLGAVAWSVDAPAVASIGSNGVARGLTEGVTAIRATVGGLSGAATLQVTATGPPSVAQVTLAPSSASLLTGETRQFAATPRDAAGTPIAGLPVDWHTNDPAIATVSSDGIVTGVGDGTTQVVATVAGVSGTARIDVATYVPSPGTWPHEPAGYSVVSDQPWSLLGTLNWILQFGTATVGIDLAAPASPPSVLTITYPTGFAGGEAPGTVMRDLPNTRRVFMGLWWKASDPWQGHETNVNKIQFLFPASGGDITMVMYGPRNGPYQLRVIPQFPGMPSNWLVPNVAQVPVTLGEWHRIEWLIDYGDQVGVGTVQWWLDGQMIGDYRDVPFPDAGMLVYKISPTWGGVGDTKTETDYFWFDQTYLSHR